MRYKIETALKTGSSVKAFKGIDILSGKKCFIKMFDADFLKREDINKRLKREVKILKKLKHKNILKFYDFITTKNSFAIVFEYIEGVSLKEFIAQNKKIPMDVGLFIIKNIAEGLYYLYENKVVHRDIKPSNILISKKGEIKIGDFGLAYQEGLPSITSSGEIVGTPCYIAPEVFQGKKADFKSDIFSFGVLCYELFTGQNPFAKETLAETMSYIITKEPPPLEEMASLDKDISCLIKKMLAKIPEKRPHIEEIIHELSRYQQRIKRGEKVLKDFFQKIPSGVKDQKPSKLLYLLYILTFILVILFPHKFAQFHIPQFSDKREKIGNVFSISKEDAKTTFIKRKKVSFLKKKKDYVYLRINILPWAEVKIDDTISFITPFADYIKLKKGKHIMRIKNPNFPEIVKMLTIGNEDTMELNIKLEEECGFLKINVIPWAEVFINQKRAFITPYANPFPLLPGKYSLTLRNPFYPEKKIPIHIQKGETLKFTYSFLKNGKNLHKIR